MIAEYSTRLNNYSSNWPQYYTRWLMTISILAFFITASFFVIQSNIILLSIVMLYVGLGLVSLFHGGRRIGPVVGLSNAITSIRSIAAIGLMVWLFILEYNRIALNNEHWWTMVLVLVVAELSDLLDGFVARKLGPTEFGAVWDMENDVAFSFVLCFLAFIYSDIGPWILLSTLIRHGYILIFRFQNDPPSCPRTFKWFAKSVCAFQLIALISIFVPVLPMEVKITLNVFSILTLFVSFGWDLLLRLQPRAQG